MLEFIEVNKEQTGHLQDLYTLLKNKRFGISHTKLPSYKEHLNFVKNVPYRKWYLIQRISETIGSFYITNENVIGINLTSNSSEDYIQIIKLILKLHLPLPPIDSCRSEYFHINANPKNTNLIKALKCLGMHHVQNTYAYKQDPELKLIQD